MLAIALLAAAASPLPVLPEWLAGHWLQCTAGQELSETWTDARGDVMLGMSKIIGSETSWEMARIGRNGNGISFFAAPADQAPTEFSATEVAKDRITFENGGHDYPQRVIYRRDGNLLFARIEGVIDGKARSSQWEYRLSPLNAACPR